MKLNKIIRPLSFIINALAISLLLNGVGWNNKGELICFDLDEYKKY